MPDKLAVGVDIGGTKIAFAIVDQSGRVYKETTIPTLTGNPYEVTINRIAQQLNVYLAQYNNIVGIGIGIPGPVDSERGIAINAVNLLWENRPIKQDLHSQLMHPPPIFVENDVNVGAIGEHLFGAGRGVSNYIYLAIGTGLGGAAMLENKLMRGVTASEMEIGHVSLDPVYGRLCTCGQRGCVEMSISGKGFIANAQENYASYPDTRIPAHNMSTYNIIEQAKVGDPLGQHVMDEAAHVLGVACAWCTMLFDPGLIILGGGLIHAAYDLLCEKMMSTMKVHCLLQLYDATTVRLSQLTNAALGASALVWNVHQESYG